MKELNGVVVGCIAIFAGFCAAFFFLGTGEVLNEIRDEYYITFPLRFIGFTLFGLLWFTPLVILNLTVNRFFKQKTSILNLIKLGVVIIAIGSLVGTSVFFFSY